METIYSILILIAAFVTTIEFDLGNSIFIVIITSVAFFAHKSAGDFLKNKKEKTVVGIYTMLFSFSIVVGNKVHYVSIRGSMDENYIDLKAFDIFSALALAFLIYITICLIIKKIDEYRVVEQMNIKGGRGIFLVSWIIIFISWIPYLLSFYPAGIVGDGASTLEYSLQEGIPDRNHWVVLYILVLRFFLKIGSMISTDINVGIFLYAIVEALVFSAVCALVVVTLKKKGVSSIYIYMIIIFYALSGFFASYSMVLWKDGIFGAGIVCVALLLWDYSNLENPSLKYCLVYGGLWLFLCFWRNNGVHILILCGIGLLIMLGRGGGGGGKCFC